MSSRRSWKPRCCWTIDSVAVVHPTLSHLVESRLSRTPHWVSGTRCPSERINPSPSHEAGGKSVKSYLIRSIAIAVGLALVVVTGAFAKPHVIRAGNLFLKDNGGIFPSKLPRHVQTPVSARIDAEIGTVDGTHPPAVRSLDIDFDRSIQINARGLPACRADQLHGPLDHRREEGLLRRDRRLRRSPKSKSPSPNRTRSTPRARSTSSTAVSTAPPRCSSSIPTSTSPPRPPSSPRSRSAASTAATTASTPWPKSRRSPAAPAR